MILGRSLDRGMPIKSTFSFRCHCGDENCPIVREKLFQQHEAGIHHAEPFIVPGKVFPFLADKARVEAVDEFEPGLGFALLRFAVFEGCGAHYIHAEEQSELRR